MRVQLRPASLTATSKPFNARRCAIICSSVTFQSPKTFTQKSTDYAARERSDFASVLGLVQWAITNKIVFTGCRPDIRDGLRGVYAVSDIASGDNLVAVPLQSSIVVRPGEPCPFPDLLPQDVWAALPWYAQLAVKLLHERCLGPTSRFADYLPALPARPDLPALWPLAQRRALQYTYLEQQVSIEEKEWNELYGKLQPYLSHRRLIREDLRWALACVRSRTFAGPYFPTPMGVKLAAGVVAAAAVALLTASVVLGDNGAAAYDLLASAATEPTAAVAGGGLLWMLPAVAAGLGVSALWQAAEARAAQTGADSTVFYAVCPFIDMFNHDSRSPTECQYVPSRDQFRVAAGAPAARGQQLLINYGSQSNDALLQRYGFVQLEGNPYDRYVFQDVRPLLEQIARAVEAGGDEGRSGPFGRDDISRLRSGELSGLEQVALMPGEAVPPQTAAALAPLLASARRGDATTPSSTLGGNQSVKPQPAYDLGGVTVKDIMAAVCREELRAAATTLEEDEEALAQLAEWQDWHLEGSEETRGQTEEGVGTAEDPEHHHAVGAGFGEAGSAMAHGREVGELAETVSDGMVSECVEQESGEGGAEEGPGGRREVLPPTELEVFGDEVDRFRTVLMFRIAKKRVLRQLVAQLQAGGSS